MESQPTTTLHPGPGGQYVAVLGPAREVWGNYLASLALWEGASLRYHRAGHAAYALAVPPTGPPVFLYWSPAGDWLTFYEVRRSETYQVVFIQAAAGRVYRVPATAELLAQLPTLSQHGPQLTALLRRAAHHPGPLVQDEAPAELYPAR